MTTSQLARWVALCGGAGLLKPGPGTWGSLLGLILGVGIVAVGGSFLGLLAAAGCFGVGCWASGRYARDIRIADPGEVVIDEAAAMILTVALVPFEPMSLILAFALFRVFDIAKPWPVSLAEQRLEGALGIMADDIVAALLSIAAVWLVVHFLLA